MELEVRDATSGADDGAKAYVGATNDNKKPTNEDANKHMEPTTEATTNINMDPKEGELNDDVVVKENDAEGVTIYGAASKDIDEVAKFIGSFIFNIDEYIIAIIRDKESETDEEAAGNTTEGVTNAVQMEEEIIP